MGVFSRMSDILQSNINSALDKAEDPEKLLSLIISEMEENLVEIRAIAAKHLAEQKTIQRKLRALNKTSSDWEEKAQKAISKERDDLARAALIEKQKVDVEIEHINGANEQVTENLEKIQEDCSRLVAKLAEAKAKRKTMQTRFEHAKTRLEVKKQVETYNVDQVLGRFESYETKIDELEAKVDAYEYTTAAKSLNDEFAQMEAEEKIEAELEALKKKVA
ncbi:phage shock protein PspA [Planctobacterium marinum]|uniref:Phage shock protein PspA n=1 Tax=Planctobacterium marinum TaxID=1631968 RepID=A0AA48I8K3_9ALTE|nr:phage shock protein PspA [Planctobacterium marinum]